MSPRLVAVGMTVYSRSMPNLGVGKVIEVVRKTQRIGASVLFRILFENE